MADTLQTKKVTDLAENTAMSDEDLFMVGSAGAASLRRLKWSNIWNTIKTAVLGKLVANNLTTTEEGYLLDARQGKALDDKISKLNTDYGSKKHYYKELTVTSDSVGRISFGSNIPSTAYEVVANVITNGQRYCVAPFIFNDGTWHSALLSDVDFSRSANVTVNVRVSYWD